MEIGRWTLYTVDVDRIYEQYAYEETKPIINAVFVRGWLAMMAQEFIYMKIDKRRTTFQNNGNLRLTDNDGKENAVLIAYIHA